MNLFSSFSSYICIDSHVRRLFAMIDLLPRALNDIVIVINFELINHLRVRYYFVMYLYLYTQR